MVLGKYLLCQGQGNYLQGWIITWTYKYKKALWKINMNINIWEINTILIRRNPKLWNKEELDQVQKLKYMGYTLSEGRKRRNRKILRVCLTSVMLVVALWTLES